MATLEQQPGVDGTLTEKQAFAELLVWAAGRPAWQQDALRRLVQSGSLQSEDILELVTLCLDPTLPHEAISDAHVSSHGSEGEPIAILKIENPTGINALAPDQKLEFGKTGLSIVYGDNGSGKSGYVRVLKHACRSRDRNSKILRDVEDVATTPQSANIVFARGEVEDEHPWTPEGQSHDDLPSVSIFDSRSANVHVEKTNAVAYTPQPMEVLEALANACDEISKRLTAKRDAIAAKTPLAIKMPQLGPSTAAGAFLHAITAKSNVAQLELLAQLSDQEKQHLATLEADLAQDPKRASGKIANQKTRLDDLSRKLLKATQASDGAAFASRDALKSDWDAKAEAAKVASDALFAASPLPDVGKATWVHLWEAARKYSDSVAYPKKTFPDAKGEDELCVLCQQPLGQEAIERRATFEAFVRGTIRTEEEAANTRSCGRGLALDSQIGADRIRCSSKQEERAWRHWLCGKISMRARFAVWPRRRRARGRRVGFWLWRRSTMAARAAMRHALAMSDCRPSAIGCCASTHADPTVLSMARRRVRDRSSTTPTGAR